MKEIQNCRQNFVESFKQLDKSRNSQRNIFAYSFRTSSRKSLIRVAGNIEGMQKVQAVSTSVRIQCVHCMSVTQ